MKLWIPLILFGALSWLIGLIVCARMARAQRAGKAIALVAIVFFGAPFAVYFALYFKDWREDRQFQADVAYVQQLCAQYGGDKIYRTVDNVEGVFQITPRPPMTEAMWQDQYGMPDPWGKAQLDSDATLKDAGPSIPIGVSKFQPESRGYWFLEQHTAIGESELPYLRRVPYRSTGVYVAKLKSRYGYQTEDLSTPELRKRWIAGGRIKIIDLQTNEVLAERTGYFRAIGNRAKTHWSGASAYGTTRMCPKDSSLGAFLKSVLIPPIERATPEQINSLRKE